MLFFKGYHDEKIILKIMLKNSVELVQMYKAINTYNTVQQNSEKNFGSRKWGKMGIKKNQLAY